MFWVSGTPLDRTRREQALDAARAALGEPAEGETWQAGVTRPEARVLVARVVAPVVEPAMAALRRVRGAWRQLLWPMPEASPRIWTT